MFPRGYGVRGIMEVKIARRAIECWPKGLRKERALIYPYLLALTCAREGGSGAGGLAAFAPDQSAAAKVCILLKKSQLLTGVVRK